MKTFIAGFLLIHIITLHVATTMRHSANHGPISVTVWSNEDGEETVLKTRLSNSDSDDVEEDVTVIRNNRITSHRGTTKRRKPKEQISRMKCRGPRAIISGHQQSPIVVTTLEAAEERSCDPIHYRDFQGPKSATVTNTGTTVDIELINSKPAIFVDNKPDVYRLQGFHFHWGGSEHLMDGATFPGEIHMVFFNELYPNETMAKECTNGVMTFAILLELSPEDNPYLEPIIMGVGKISMANSKAALPAPLYLRGLLPECLSKYYYYFGSFTTPPFYESVSWIVFEQAVPVSKQQLSRFQSLREGRRGSRRIMSNNREPQPLDGRQVFSTTHCPCF